MRALRQVIMFEDVSEPRRRIPAMEQRGFPEEVRATFLSPGSAGRSPARCLKSARWLARSGPDSERSPQASRDRSRRPACRRGDRKSTRLNSSHEWISYAVFCLKKKKKKTLRRTIY